MSYVKMKDVDQVIMDHYKKTQQELNFYDAVMRLKEEGKTLTHVQKPQFLDWNLEDNQELCTLIENIPIMISNLSPPQIIPNKKELFVLTPYPIMVFRENYYCSKNFFTGNSYALTYVLKGKLLSNIENEEYHIKEKQLFLTLPHRRYCSYHTYDDIVLMVTIDEVLFQKVFFGLLHHNIVLSSFLNNSFHEQEPNYLLCNITNDKEIRYVFQHLFHEFLYSDQYSQDLNCNYVEILCTYLIRGLENTNCNFLRKKKPFYHHFPEISQYIQNNYQSITLKKLADEFHYERSYLGKCLREVSGLSFSEMISTIKLDKAKAYLLQTTLSIEEVSFLSGYSSSDYFSHCFKKNVGVSPKAFRDMK